MEAQDIIDLIANLLAIAVMVVKAYKAAKPSVMLRAQSLWHRTRQAASADVAAARSGPLWRKVFAGLAIPSVVGGFLAYGLTGGMDDAAPLWALCWVGSITAGGVLGCAAAVAWRPATWPVCKNRLEQSLQR